jgi:NAD(P)-dependent dehydrogenase (short-subunit alcohol dehydrogenase family)
LPLKRHATPEEIATAVVYLASDESAFMTAQRLRWTVVSLDK